MAQLITHTHAHMHTHYNLNYHDIFSSVKFKFPPAPGAVHNDVRPVQNLVPTNINVLLCIW